MPALQGEVSLLTLFADIHYTFSPPHIKPPHHRFDKTSYVYLYHNPIQQRGRLEIANYAGTPEQDAFIGYLDSVRVERSHKHPTLFTLVADGIGSQNGSAASTPHQDISQWHLPAYDQRNEAKYMYKLHTVDIYFWTVEDSTMFLDSMRRVLHESQLRILDAPQPTVGLHPEQRDNTISPVVQKLEQAAISGPYQGGRNSISTTHSFAGPPSAMTPASAHTTSPPPPPPPTAQQHQQPVEAPSNFAPMAYNPAAPAAPEPIAHRDPTPPPPDADQGTGLTAAAHHEHGNQFAPPPHQHQASFSQQPYMPGHPQQHNQGYQPSPVAGTPPGVQRTNTTSSFPPPPTGAQGGFTGPPQHSSTPQPGIQRHSTISTQQGYPTQQYAGYSGSPGQQGMQSPGFPSIPGNKPSQTPQPHTPGYPPQSPGFAPQAQGGYSQYQYGQQQQQQQPGNQYGVHQQAYRPTEAEAGSHHAKPTMAPQGAQPPSRLDAGAKKFEKGVSSFLKKLDKKF